MSDQDNELDKAVLGYVKEKAQQQESLLPLISAKEVFEKLGPDFPDSLTSVFSVRERVEELIERQLLKTNGQGWAGGVAILCGLTSAGKDHLSPRREATSIVGGIHVSTTPTVQNFHFNAPAAGNFGAAGAKVGSITQNVPNERTSDILRALADFRHAIIASDAPEDAKSEVLEPLDVLDAEIAKPEGTRDKYRLQGAIACVGQVATAVPALVEAWHALSQVFPK